MCHSRSPPDSCIIAAMDAPVRQQGVPLRADPGAVRRVALATVARVAVAHLLAKREEGVSPDKIVERMWPRDGGGGFRLADRDRQLAGLRSAPHRAAGGREGRGPAA